jgi:hypothetical protein
LPVKREQKQENFPHGIGSILDFLLELQHIHTQNVSKKSVGTLNTGFTNKAFKKCQVTD